MALIKNTVFQWAVALVVTVLVAAWPTKQAEKALKFRIVALTPLGPEQAKGFTDLKLYKGGEAVEKPHLATVRVTNTGDLPIGVEDFGAPIEIKLPQKPTQGIDVLFIEPLGVRSSSFKGMGQLEVLRLVDARIAGTNPPEIPLKLSIKSNAVEIAPVLLNAGDAFVVEMLTSGAPSDISLNARIKGIQNVEREVSLDEGERGRRRVGHMTLLVAFLLFILGPVIEIYDRKPAAFPWWFGPIAATALSVSAGILLVVAYGLIEWGFRGWLAIAGGVIALMLVNGLTLYYLRRKRV